MTGAHFHLAFNHVPVVLVPVAVVMLSYALAGKSADLTKGALVLLIVSTLFGAGAFLTGDRPVRCSRRAAHGGCVPRHNSRSQHRGGPSC
jgi:uncharacterized membrane protein